MEQEEGGFLSNVRNFFLRFEVLVLSYSFGILQYFYLTREISYFSVLLFILILLVCIFIRSNKLENFIYINIFAFSLGILISKINVPTTSILKRSYDYVNVTGKIEKIENLTKTTKFILSELKFTQKIKEQPEKIVFFAKKKEYISLNMGDVINVNINLRPYNFPIIPSKIYLNILEYNESIAGTGFAYGEPILKQANIKNNILNHIEKFRRDFSQKVRKNIAKDDAAIIDALSIGERGGISENLNNSIRRSGLAHLLSISGMHLSIVVGIFFVTLRFALNLIPIVNNNMDLKKISAYFAMMGSLGYLLISGMKVATIRAYIMSNLGLISVITGNFYNLTRAIFLSMTILLTIKPIYILSAAFQLSFAAVMSIDAFLKRKKKNTYPINANIFRKLFFHIINNSMFTFSAMIGGFWISTFHFYQFNNYGILSNLIAIPLTSLVIMPLIIILIFLYFLNADYLFNLSVKLLTYPVKILAYTADITANLKYSVTFFGEIPGYIAIIGIIASLLIILIANKKIYIIGLFINFVCFIIICNIPKPDLILDSENNNIVIFADNRIFYTNNNYSNFKKKILKEAYNAKNIEKITKFSNVANIKYLNGDIIFQKYSHKIFISLKNWPEKPEKYDLLISAKTIRNIENLPQINKKSLIKNGNYYIYISKNLIKYNTSREIYGDRRWISNKII